MMAMASAAAHSAPAELAMPVRRFPFKAMACACEIVFGDTDVGTVEAEKIAQAAIDEVHRVEVKYSRYRSDSIISRINAAAGGDWTDCDAETRGLLDFADSLYRSSDGLFDITAGVLRRVWDFKNACLPSTAALDEARALIGWSGVEREASRIRLPRVGMELDFGGFGKEYAADRAAHIIAQRGIRHGYVNLGGDMRVLGPKPDGQPWMMGIQDPRIADKVVATIPVMQGGLATSGDYERYFEIDGRRYCHVMNPRTGQPVQYWQTISVVAPLAVVAGNCTTIAMLREAAALDFLQASGFSYLAIDQTGAIFVSGAQETSIPDSL
jgi:thiamine biosynthesis lipoprotein